MGSGQIFVVLGAQVRVLILIDNCHWNANIYFVNTHYAPIAM